MDENIFQSLRRLNELKNRDKIKEARIEPLRRANDGEYKDVNKSSSNSFIGTIFGSIRRPIEAVDRYIRPERYKNEPSLTEKFKKDIERSSNPIDRWIYKKIDDTQNEKAQIKDKFNKTLYTAKHNPEVKKVLMQRMIEEKNELAQKYPDYLERAKTSGQNSDWNFMRLVDIDPELAYEKFARKYAEDQFKKDYGTSKDFFSGLTEGIMDFSAKHATALMKLPELTELGARSLYRSGKGFIDVARGKKSIDDVSEEVRSGYIRDKEVLKNKYKFVSGKRDALKKVIEENLISNDTPYAKAGRFVGELAGDMLSFMTAYKELKLAQINQLEKAGKFKRAEKLKKNVATFEELAPDILASVPMSVVNTLANDGDAVDFAKDMAMNSALGGGAILGEKALRKVFEKLKDVDFERLTDNEIAQKVVEAVNNGLDIEMKRAGFVDFNQIAKDISGAVKNKSGKNKDVDKALIEEINKAKAEGKSFEEFVVDMVKKGKVNHKTMVDILFENSGKGTRNEYLASDEYKKIYNKIKDIKPPTPKTLVRIEPEVKYTANGEVPTGKYIIRDVASNGFILPKRYKQVGILGVDYARFNSKKEAIDFIKKSNQNLTLNPNDVLKTKTQLKNMWGDESKKNTKRKTGLEVAKKSVSESIEAKMKKAQAENKSFDEWWGEQEKVFRGTKNKTDDPFVKDSGFFVSKSKDYAGIYAGKNGVIHEYIIPNDVKIIDFSVGEGRDIYKRFLMDTGKTYYGDWQPFYTAEKDIIEYLKKNNIDYDGFTLREGDGSISIRLKNKDKIKNKSQFKKLWDDLQKNTKSSETSSNKKTIEEKNQDNTQSTKEKEKLPDDSSEELVITPNPKRTKKDILPRKKQTHRKKLQKPLDIEALLRKTESDIRGIASSKPIVPRIFEMPKETRWQAFRRWAEDSNIRLKVFKEELEKFTGKDVPDYLNLYMQKDMLPRVISRRIEKYEKRRIKFLKGLIEDDISLQEMDEYMSALHAPERNAMMKKIAEKEGREPIDGLSGMTDEEAEKILQEIKSSGKYKKLQKHERILRKIMNDTLDFQVSLGLLKKEEAEKIRSIYKYYIPLQRDLYDDELMFLGIGQGVDIRGREIKRAKGSTKRVISPTSQIFQAFQKTQVRALKNEIGKTIINLVKKHPELKSIFDVKAQKYRPIYDEMGELQYLEPQMKLADDVIGTKINGKQYFITVNDKRMVQALKNLNMAQLGIVEKVFRAFTGAFSSMATRFNPEFWITNFQRDVVEALINAKAEGISTKGIAKAIMRDIPNSQKEIWTALRKGKEPPKLKEFLDLGGDTGHFWLQDVKEAEKSMQKLEKELKNEGLEKIKNPIRKTIKLIDDINTVVELGTRYAAYKEFIKRGMTKKKAIQSAADLTINFSRQGEAMPKMKAFYAFANPAVQGASKMIRTLYKSPKARKVAGGLVALGFINRAIQDEINSNDSIPDWMREKQLVLEFPDDFPVLGGKQVSFWQMPYGYAPFFTLGANLYDMGAKKITKGEGLASTLRSTFSAFSPVDASFSGGLPTFAKPFGDIYSNTNFMGTEVHPEWNTLRSPKTPNYLEHKKGTSEIAKSISELLFKFSRGYVDIYPDNIDHVAKSYTAGAGKFVSNTLDTAIKLAKGEKIDSNQIPFIRKVVSDADVKKKWKIYRDIRETLDVVGIRDIGDIREKRFMKALRDGVRLGYLDEKTAKQKEIAFYKGKYRIPSIPKTFKKSEPIDPELEKKVKEAFARMPNNEKARFFNLYSKSMANKYRFILENGSSKAGESGTSTSSSGVRTITKEDIEYLKTKRQKFLEMSREERIKALKALKEKGFTKQQIEEALLR